MANKGENVWDSLKGAKEGLKGEVQIKMGEKEAIMPIKFVEIDEIQEINQEYIEMLPEKPIVSIPMNGTKIKIKVPSDEEKYKPFNNHPKAQEWEQKLKPIEEEKKLRLAYKFIEDDYKPGDSLEEGMKIIKDSLREIDIINILNKGYELNGISDRLQEARKNF